MSKNNTKRKKDIEAKLAVLHDEAKRVRLRLSALEDQIADCIGDLQVMQVNGDDES